MEYKVIGFNNNVKSLWRVNNEEASLLKPTGSDPDVTYGLLKIHKPSVLLRPIIPFNTTSYKLVKFLFLILSPFTTSWFTVKNTFEYHYFLSIYSLSLFFHMISHDVRSLFTNIPLDEIRDIYNKQINHPHLYLTEIMVITHQMCIRKNKA